MTVVTQETDVSRSEALAERMQNELLRISSELDAFRTHLERGEGHDTAAAKAEVKRITDLIGSCMKVETRIEEIKCQQKGIGPCGYAVDLAAARDSIRRKLHRLRDRGDAG